MSLGIQKLNVWPAFVNNMKLQYKDVKTKIISLFWFNCFCIESIKQILGDIYHGYYCFFKYLGQSHIYGA